MLVQRFVLVDQLTGEADGGPRLGRCDGSAAGQRVVADLYEIRGDPFGQGQSQATRQADQSAERAASVEENLIAGRIGNQFIEPAQPGRQRYLVGGRVDDGLTGMSVIGRALRTNEQVPRDRRYCAGRGAIQGMQPRFPSWSDLDAWVFSSIKGTGRHDGYRLSEIIANADFINHAILTEAEFTHAVPRLLAAGLIGADVQIDRSWLTEAGQALHRQRMKRRGLFGSSTGLPRDTSGALRAW